jgi:hypothetical protein
LIERVQPEPEDMHKHFTCAWLVVRSQHSDDYQTELKMTILSTVRVPVGTIPAWEEYGYIFMPMGSIHTIPVKSWVGHEYSFVPYPALLIISFYLTHLLLLTYILEYENVTTYKGVEIIHFLIMFVINKSKIVSDMCTI